MSVDEMENWLKSRQPARIDQLNLRPREHTLMPHMPMSSQKGQATVYFLLCEDGSAWVLKKFHQGRNLDRAYLVAVSNLLPSEKGFLSGKQRRILSSNTLQKGQGCYFSKGLDKWLDGTILMPQIKGVDWAALADGVRDGSLQLDLAQRLTLCRGLTGLVMALEKSQCSHRDLSSGNVFIDPNAWIVCLIDFDSMQHPTLRLPTATTCGTIGYAAPFVWNNGNIDAAATWCERADRYALVLLNTEFLVAEKGFPLSAEGGMFNQDELRARAGKSLSFAISRLKANCPSVLPIFEAAIRSHSFDTCPSPEDLLRTFSSLPGAPIAPPALREVEEASPLDFEWFLKRQRPAAPLWPAPRLADLPPVTLEAPGRTAVRPAHAVALPQDPWRNPVLNATVNPRPKG